jgi:hypothetical protein
MRGALRDFKPLRHFARGEPAASLQQHQCGEKAIGFHVGLLSNSGEIIILSEL